MVDLLPTAFLEFGMPLFRHADKVIFFAHIPRTGGSTIEKVLGRSSRRAMQAPNAGDWAVSTPQHIHAAIYARLRLVDFADYSFTVVRHPYARIVSEYKVSSAKGFADGRAASFRDWFSRRRLFLEENRYMSDNHLRPQVDFLDSRVEVFKFEQGIPQILRTVGERAGFPIHDEDQKVGLGPDVRIAVSRESLAMVADYYSEDFAQLGYSADVDAFAEAAKGEIELSDQDTMSLRGRMRVTRGRMRRWLTTQLKPALSS